MCSTGGTTAIVDMPLNAHPTTTTNTILKEKVDRPLFVIAAFFWYGEFIIFHVSAETLRDYYALVQRFLSKFCVVRMNVDKDRIHQR